MAMGNWGFCDGNGSKQRPTVKSAPKKKTSVSEAEGTDHRHSIDRSQGYQKALDVR